LQLSRIFISYRRSDGAGYAGRIFDRLQKEFGAARVYRDVDSLEDGTRFPDDIAEQLTKCGIVLVVIGPTWCGARNAAGGRRLDDPGDWVRIEVTEALKRGVCVIPVIVGGARLPDASDLPEDIRDLTQRQARELRDGDTWGGDLDLLVQRIAKELGVFRPLAQLRGLAFWIALAVLGAATVALSLRHSSDSISRSPGETYPTATPKSEAPNTVTANPAETLKPAEAPKPAQASSGDWAGSWNSAEITDPDYKDQKFTLIIEFELIGDNLIGRVKDGIARFPITDPKVTGNSISFYTQSEVTTSGDKLMPYKQLYYGVRTGETIRFRSWDDLGGTPFEFEARRTGPTRK
jgi:hypothetical protein